jgi:[ribosomal protein S5]-alanine N-acetyltransferase
MLTQLTLSSERLLLRPFHPQDENDLQHLASQREIADTMISLPHPYPDGHAQRCIVRYTEDLHAGRAAHFAITLKASGQLLGSVELRDIDREHLQAESSFWLAQPWWGQGYATEALRSVLPYGFQKLGLNRIYAHHLARNAASGRVLEKAGFQREGLLRQRVRKWEVFEDVVALALLREEWAARAKEPLCKNT